VYGKEYDTATFTIYIALQDIRKKRLIRLITRSKHTIITATAQTTDILK